VLASIHNADDNAFIKSNMIIGDDHVWIGLNDRSSEGNFTWSDGTSFNYSDFSTGESNIVNDEDCVEMGARDLGWWNDADCDKTHTNDLTPIKALCMQPIPTSVPTRIPTQGPSRRSSPDPTLRRTLLLMTESNVWPQTHGNHYNTRESTLTAPFSTLDGLSFKVHIDADN
jgi:hypothetical protein